MPEEERGGAWRNVLTGEQHSVEVDGDVPGLRLSRVLGKFPVALLARSAPA